MHFEETSQGFMVTCPKCGESFPLRYNELAAVFGLTRPSGPSREQLVASVFCTCSLRETSRKESHIEELAKHAVRVDDSAERPSANTSGTAVSDSSK